MIRIQCCVVLASLVLAAISGCATPEQIAAEQRRKAEQQNAARAQMRLAIEGKCRSYGFTAGTTAFSNCLMQMDQQVQAALREARARSELESQCDMARAQGLAAPTRTGGFGESVQNGNVAYANCMAGLPSSQPKNIVCQRQGKDDVYCFSQ